MMLRYLSSSLIMNESITTTLPRAKELQRFVEPIITAAKAGKDKSFRRVRRDINDKKAVVKLYDVIAQRYTSRPGGYTRIYRLGSRKGDNADIAMVKLLQ